MSPLALSREVVARHLDLEPHGLDPDRPMALYGLDSLRALELTAALEEATGLRLPEWFCLEHPTLNRLAAALGEVSTGQRESGWQADAKLPDDFKVAPGRGQTTPMRHVLLTGATGFLGAYLLARLLAVSRAQVWCLVRAPRGQGLARVRSNLSAYGLWREAFSPRLEIVLGDMARPSLGLDPAEYSGVASMIDVIYHAAADVDWVQPYAALRDVNVAGTLEILRLAASARAKPVRFVSSLSVGFVPGGPPLIDETTDCLPFVDRLPLGYAATKCVAEALCRQAAGRGLPVHLFRPGLVTGDSRSGASNPDDLVSRLVRGCIELGVAPDLDWTLDAVPVDEVARAVVDARVPAAGICECTHVTARRPRTWQECVLWINLHGYRCRLLPFPDWQGVLQTRVASPAHPLHPLRSFFLRDAAQGASPAELYQVARRSAVASGSCTSSNRAEVDARRLSLYLDHYASRGLLPVANTAPRCAPLLGRLNDVYLTPDALEARLNGQNERRPWHVRAIRPLASDASFGLLSDLSASRRGARTGLFHYQLDVERAGTPATLPVVMKARPRDDDAVEASIALAAMCGEALEQQVRTFQDRIGLRGASDREAAIYQHAGLRHLVPACYGIWTDEAGGRSLLLERLDAPALLNALDPGQWTDADLEAALTGLAEIHATALTPTLQSALSPRLRSAATVRELAPLWDALADHAASAFDAWGGPGTAERHRSLLDSLEEWVDVLDATPQTLLHHDFNPRNIAVRRERGEPRLCTYDWELATTGLPQRDLAELVCFVLPPDVDAERLGCCVQRYREEFERTTGTEVEAEAWRAGFQAAMALLLVDRLAFYAMIHRVRRQGFLPRVLRTWRQIDQVIR